MSTSATSFELADGVLTFYFAPNQNPDAISYDVYGYLPGQYRALPASIRSAYEPGRFHLGSASELRVRQPASRATDPYKPTPDELYARGKAHFDAGRFAEAGEALEPLFGGYTLRDDIAKDAARMLLLDQHQGRPAAEDRHLLRGRQGESARADPHVQPASRRSARRIARSRNMSGR